MADTRIVQTASPQKRGHYREEANFGHKRQRIVCPRDTFNNQNDYNYHYDESSGDYKHANYFKSRQMFCHVCRRRDHDHLSPQCPAVLMEPNSDVTPFQGEHDVLSNLYTCKVQVFGQMFGSSEHAYQWKKAMICKDFNKAKSILCAPSGKQAKFRSKGIKLTDEFNDKKISILQEIATAKAQCVEEYRETLKKAKPIIVEAVKGDLFWSVGLPKEEVLWIRQDFWPGENHMGRIHMKVRNQHFGSPDNEAYRKYMSKVDPTYERAHDVRLVVSRSPQKEIDNVCWIERTKRIENKVKHSYEKTSRKPERTVIAKHDSEALASGDDIVDDLCGVSHTFKETNEPKNQRTVINISDRCKDSVSGFKKEQPDIRVDESKTLGVGEDIKEEVKLTQTNTAASKDGGTSKKKKLKRPNLQAPTSIGAIKDDVNSSNLMMPRQVKKKKVKLDYPEAFAEVETQKPTADQEIPDLPEMPLKGDKEPGTKVGKETRKIVLNRPTKQHSRELDDQLDSGTKSIVEASETGSKEHLAIPEVKTSCKNLNQATSRKKVTSRGDDDSERYRHSSLPRNLLLTEDGQDRISRDLVQGEERKTCHSSSASNISSDCITNPNLQAPDNLTDNCAREPSIALVSDSLPTATQESRSLVSEMVHGPDLQNTAGNGEQIPSFKTKTFDKDSRPGNKVSRKVDKVSRPFSRSSSKVDKDSIQATGTQIKVDKDRKHGASSSSEVDKDNKQASESPLKVDKHSKHGASSFSNKVGKDSKRDSSSCKVDQDDKGSANSSSKVDKDRNPVASSNTIEKQAVSTGSKLEDEDKLSDSVLFLKNKAAKGVSKTAADKATKGVVPTQLSRRKSDNNLSSPSSTSSDDSSDDQYSSCTSRSSDECKRYHKFKKTSKKDKETVKQLKQTETAKLHRKRTSESRQYRHSGRRSLSDESRSRLDKWNPKDGTKSARTDDRHVGENKNREGSSNKDDTRDKTCRHRSSENVQEHHSKMKHKSGRKDERDSVDGSRHRQQHRTRSPDRHSEHHRSDRHRSASNHRHRSKSSKGHERPATREYPQYTKSMKDFSKKSRQEFVVESNFGPKNAQTRSEKLDITEARKKRRQWSTSCSD